jgi:hypothetical protein
MKQQYKSYQETVAFLKESVQRYPNLITIKTIGTTWEGREIILATISIDVENADLKPALLFTGTIHAREWIGNELSVHFIDYLLKNYQSDPKVASALTKNTLYMVPCLNPDGFEYSRQHFSFWRKNRRNNKDGTYGVDLNRNFDIGFVKTKDTSSNVYSGPEPFSEPETRAMRDFVAAHDNITIALDYHSQGNVFFPAHMFNHEAEINGTDLNLLCANMNYEIKKVTGREYGIHRGKPPTKLISGSGREHYYAKGIIAAVVEVGTRNIPDYMQNMTESIDENIPALLYALSEAKNYAPFAPKRVENFHIEHFSSDSVTLAWEIEENPNIFYQLFRSNQHKQATREENLIATTSQNHFKDIQLKSGEEYFYYIRAIDKISNTKSPFAPQLKVKTLLNREEFSRTIFPAPTEIGYVAEKSQEQNREHFGKNSLFVGVSQGRGISYGVMAFSLANLPENAIIHDATISLYPMNRVNAKIEKYGEWSLSFINQESVSELTDFQQIHEAEIIQTLGETIKSEKLTQGIWREWHFNDYEKAILQQEIKNKKVLFRFQGPTELPLGRDSQMMQFDLGYGPYGGGIHYRPHIDIKYTLPSTELIIKPLLTHTISKEKIITDKLACGYDKDGDKIYGYMEFDLSVLPDPDETVITDAYILIGNKNKPKLSGDARYNVEFIDTQSHAYDDIKNRDRIEFIGYELSLADLKKRDSHHLLFDRFSLLELENFHKESKHASFIVKATTISTTKEHLVNWYGKDDKQEVKLIINYIKRSKHAPAPCSMLSTSIEKGMVKLTWNNPDDEKFVGAYVVRNRFHPPKNPYDGVKLYAGSDNYTYDNFGSTKIDKYYAVFAYDDVPNFSEPTIVAYKEK